MIQMRSISRRQFVAATAAGSAALLFPARNVLGANEAINIGFLGLGGRGNESARWFSTIPGVRVAALCDADETRMAEALKKHPNAKTEKDLRKVIEDKDIDAVVISTCNHWHALASIWACQAGKDVYVEKPVSQTVWEGRKMVEAARKYNRIVQGGTQQRSDPCQKKIKEFITSGKLGAMKWIRGNRFGVRASIGKQDTPLKPPASIDYDLWLGPAQDEPMYRRNFHYDWHWVWNTGSGEMGNWGVHILDDIRNALSDQASLPRRILAGGGRVAWNDAGETPNVHFVYFDIGSIPVIFSLSNLPAKKRTDAQDQTRLPAQAYRGVRDGYVIQFEEGYYAGGRGGGWCYDNKGKKIEGMQAKGDGGGAHARNFIDAVRSRDRSKQNAEIEQTHYSSAWCHLANIAYRVGSDYKQDDAAQAARDFKPWQELLDGFHKHLDANGVDPASAGLKASGFLELDPAKETFTGPSATPKALALLTREYRKGFAVPENV
jgi:predicted dehydrogenase